MVIEMKDDPVTKLLQAVAEHVREDWEETGVPCPAPELLRDYLQAFLADLPEEQFTREQRCTETHVYSCKRCYQQFQTWLNEDATQQYLAETRVLVENRNDARGLIRVLRDATRPSWVRAMAADYLTEIGGQTAIEDLQRVAESDADDEVREAASEALKELQPLAGRISQWLGRKAEETVAAIRLWTQSPIGDLAPVPAAAAEGEEEAEGKEPQTVRGTSDDGRLRWEIRRRGDEIAVDLDTEDETLAGATVRLFLRQPDQEQPSFTDEVTLYPIGTARYGATHFLGRLRDIALTDDSRLVLLVLREADAGA
jgi:hypothetical protein